MTNSISSEQLIAAALYKIRLLLASYLGSESTAELPVRIAAHLAYALHNDALLLLEGEQTNVSSALARIGAVDGMFDSQLLQRLPQHAGKADV